MKSAAVLVALAALVACRSGSKKKIDQATIDRNLLDEVPAQIENKVDADLGGKVIYLGNEVNPHVLGPGKTATVVHYWKVVEPPGEGWQVFSHLLGASDHWMNLDYSEMREGYPVASWKAGDVIRDEQSFTLESPWKSSSAQLVVGLWKKDGNQRMEVVSGPHDAERRVLAYKWPVDPRGRAFKPMPMYKVRRASGPVTIDGKDGEPDWKLAQASPTFEVAEGGPKLAGSARARLLWDDKNLYAFVDVEDPDVHSQYKKQDDPLWKEDVVELFIDADRNRRGYVELQVNPRNAHFDAWFPVTRAKDSHFEWTSGMKSAVQVKGTIDQRGDHDKGWSVEIAIPLADVKGMDPAMKVNIPPLPGDRWRLNLIRVDLPRGAEGVAASSWSPITIRDFHALGRMLNVVFADASGEVPGKPDEVGGAPGDAAPPL
jgi:hypothetical protein